MRLAICVAIKNRSCVLVQPENSLLLLAHVYDKLEPCEQHRMNVMMTKDGRIILPLMPRMLRSLATMKKAEDDWVLVVVDYKSNDVDMKEMLEYELKDKIPYHLEVVEDYQFFDRGGGLDKAAKIAETKFNADIVFFCDADLEFHSHDVFDGAIEVCSKGNFYYPIFYTFAVANHECGFWRDTSYGNFACRLSDYKKTDGWLHNISWGWEDRALADSIPEDKKVREKANGFFHQWHPLAWEFRVKEYPIKHYMFKEAAVKDLPST